MTEVKNVRPRPTARNSVTSDHWDAVPSRVWSAFWAARWMLVVAVVVAAVVSALVALSLQERYAAEARLQVEPAPRSLVGLQPDPQPRPTRDRSPLENEVQILRSADTLAQMAQDMRLNYSTEFAPALAWPVWWRSWAQNLPLGGLLGGDGPAAPASGWQRRKVIVDELQSRLSINGIGESHVLGLSFEASDPMFAEAILNALIEARRTRAMQLNVEEIDRATGWLGRRIADLQRAVQAKEAEGLQLRRAAGLARGFRAELVEEQISSVVLELSAARSRLLLADARRRVVEQAVAAGNVGQIPEVVASSLVQELVQLQVTRENELRQLEMEAPRQDPRRTAAERAVADLEARVQREMDNIAASITNEAASYRAWVEQLERQLDILKRQAADLGEQEVRAAAVMLEVEAGREVLANLMETFMKLQEQQDVRLPGGTLIQAAVTPPSAVYPKKKLIVLAAVVFAGTATLALVAGAYLARPHLRRRILLGAGIVAGFAAGVIGVGAVMVMLSRPAADSMYGWMSEGQTVTALFRSGAENDLTPGQEVAVKIAGHDGLVEGVIVETSPWTEPWPGGQLSDGGLVAATVSLPGLPIEAAGVTDGVPARVQLAGRGAQ